MSTSSSGPADAPGTANRPAGGTRAGKLLDGLFRRIKFVFFFCGLFLLIGAAEKGSNATYSQNAAIAKGLTACGLAVAGGLSLV